MNVAGCKMGHQPTYWSPYRIPTLRDGPDGEYLTDRLTDEAISLIRDRGGRPFFLNLCYYSVHTPLEGKPELVEKYRAKAASLGLDSREPFEEGEEFPCEHKRGKRVRRRLFHSDPVYAAMVENLDWNVGRLAAAIEDEGIADDTLVIFTSDNGGLSTAEGSPTSNAPLSEGKGWMYDGGTREPMIARLPGVTKPNTLSRVPVTSTDFYPTFLEVAGLEPIPEQHVDGASILSALGGSEAPLPRDGIFWHYPHYSNQGGTPGASVRSGDRKLIEFFEDRHVELYDLREDVGEERDLAGREPDAARELRERLWAWLEEVGARIPEVNPDYVPPGEGGP